MKGPVQMASCALLWNKIKISFHLTLEPMGGFLGMNDHLRWIILRAPWIGDWLQWMSTFWNCGKSMRNKEPGGIYPLKCLFHSDQIFRGLDHSKALKGNPGCYAVVLEVFTTLLLPECSVEPWREAHSEELSPCCWLASGDSPRVRAACVGSGICCHVSSLVHSLVQAQTQQGNLDPGCLFTLEYEADDIIIWAQSNCAPDLGWVIMALREIGIWVQTRIYKLACYHCSLLKMLRDGFGVLFFSRLFLGFYVRSERNKDIRGCWSLVCPWEEEIRPATSVRVLLGFLRINI